VTVSTLSASVSQPELVVGDEKDSLAVDLGSASSSLAQAAFVVAKHTASEETDNCAPHL
jgi:hypothetical protein